MTTALEEARAAKLIGSSLQASLALPPATDPALEREVADLRKRLEVLERIATEDRKTRELSDQIERLR